MNVAEFQEWLADYFLCFPPAKSAFIKAATGKDAFGNPQDKQAELAGHWFDILAFAELDVAMLVTKQMLAGTLPEVGKFDHHETPKHVARYCREKSSEHRSRQRNDVPTAPVAGRLPWESNTKAIERQLAKCIEDGGDAHALALELMPIPDDQLPRYRCLVCKDRGTLTVWARKSMRLAAVGKLTVGHGTYRTLVACNCARGEQHGGDEDKKLITYRPANMLPCNGYKDSDIAELVEFVTSVTHKQNYVAGFETGAW